jgi:hypothetical protein
MMTGKKKSEIDKKSGGRNSVGQAVAESKPENSPFSHLQSGALGAHRPGRDPFVKRVRTAQCIRTEPT